MMNYIIDTYIKNLSFEDYNNYLISKNIIINDKTNHFFYDILKNNYKDILKRPEYYLNIIKNNVDNYTYNKIYELYTIYSKKLYH